MAQITLEKGQMRVGESSEGKGWRGQEDGVEGKLALNAIILHLKDMNGEPWQNETSDQIRFLKLPFKLWICV